MTKAYRRAALLTIILCSFFASSYACKCAGPGSVDAAVKSASAVFTGKVVKIDYVGLAETFIPDSVEVARSITKEHGKNALDNPTLLKATIVISTDFKGVMKNDTVIVYTGIRGATCGYKFEVNKEYTIYASTDSYMYLFFHIDKQRLKSLSRKNAYWTSICSRTTIAVGQEQSLLAEALKKR